MMIQYKNINGIDFNINTPDQLANLIIDLYNTKTRIIVDYGNTETKQSWNEIHDIRGYIGKSTGSIKVPLLVYNKRSYGGTQLLTDCILSIKTTKGNKTLYDINNNGA